MKALFGFLSFIFFLIVLVLLLVGGFIWRTYRKIRVAAERASERQARQHREETGRQRQQYNQRHQTYQAGNNDEMQEDFGPRKTQTATGETIIDNRHQERENKKIFDDSDGEYVDFVEEA
jgi:flagellar biosynthesis/type III secretory pathway M-ring protein FliF/YscJ